MSDDTLRIWDCRSGNVVARFIGDGPLTSCAFTPDGRRVVVGDQWGRLHLFAFENQQ
jgi:WD40 repeat protein